MRNTRTNPNGCKCFGGFARGMFANYVGFSLCVIFTVWLAGCGSDDGVTPPVDGASGSNQPPKDKRYGIYSMDLGTGAVNLIYSSDHSLHKIQENTLGTKIVFREDFGSDPFTSSEICIVDTDGTGYQRLTNNSWLDAYPGWSPDDSLIVFLSWPDHPSNTMDIFVMDADGQDPVELYDSGFHDGDCSWTGTKIVFTRESQIWTIDQDGTNATQVTDYARAGEAGAADLPFGDYDPRINPAGTLICFDRMVDDQVPSGNFDFYTINLNGSGETAITSTGYSQFMPEWSHTSDRLVYTLAAIDGQGVFDIHVMDADGSNDQNLTPSGWPANFLCSHPVFSHDDAKIYFTGEFYQ